MDGEADKVISLLPWEIAVRRASTRKQAYALIERKDADAAIKALSEIESYYLIKELGLESSLPILAVIEPEQITALFDLDIWHEERPELDDLLLWLDAFREADLEQLYRAVRATDPELIALLFRRRLLIYVLPSNPDDESPADEVPLWVQDPPEDIMPLMETPDRRFILAARAMDEEAEKGNLDEEARKLILELVDLLYKDTDFEPIATALKAAHDDLSTTLEDDAHRFHTARLEDLGFPESTRAAELYAPLDPDRALAVAEERLLSSDLEMPALHASRFGRGFFHEVMHAVQSPDVVRRVEGELISLGNTAAVADRVEPGDMRRLRDVLDRTRAYLELALSHRTGSLSEATARIEQHSLRTLFGVGYGLTVQLQRRAKQLRARGSFRSGNEAFALVADEERALLHALELKRPRVAFDNEEVRPFHGREDFQRASSMLDELFAMADALDAHGFAAKNEKLSGENEPPIASERPAEMLLVTAAANVLLGRGFELQALDGSDLTRLTPERFSEEELQRAVLPLSDAAVRTRVMRGLRALSEALAPLVGRGEIDPRFVGVVVRRLR